MIAGRRGFLLGAAALMWSPCLLAAKPPGDLLVFNVMRKGSKIGEHRLSFVSDRDTLIVNISVDIVIQFGPIALFRYRHRNVEHWQGDTFAGFDAQTYDDGDNLKASASREGDTLYVQGTRAKRYAAPPNTLAATHWNMRMLNGPMINTQDGKLLRPTVTALGPTPAPGSAIPARQFSLTGDLKLDLWYDDADAWTALRFIGSDGSLVTYEKA